MRRIRPFFGFVAPPLALAMLLSACSTAATVPGSAGTQTYRQTSFADAASGLYAYISDYNGNFVDEFDPSGNLILKITNQLNGPTGLFVDSSHNLWVANGKAGNVLMFPEGATSPTRTLSDSGGTPIGVTIGPDGTAYVANGNDSGGAPGSVWIYPPGRNAPTRSLSDPNMAHFFFVAVDPRNDVFVSAYLKGLPQFIGAADEFVGAKQSGLRRLRIRMDEAGGVVYRNGYVYICDNGEEIVSQFTDKGVFTGRIMPTGASWYGIDVSPEGVVLGADDTNNRGSSRRFPGARMLTTYSDPAFTYPVGAAFQTGTKGY